MTTEENQVKFTHPDFKKYVDLLTKNGFQCYFKPLTYQRDHTYCFIVKDDKIAYIQSDFIGRVSFSTEHVPKQGIGTGFGLDDYMSGDANPTIERAVEAVNMRCPKWERRNCYKVEKYKNWEDRCKRSKFNENFFKYEISK